MALLTVFSHCEETIYKNKILSKATIFVFLSTIAAIIVPFIIAYKTGGIWKTHQIVFDQPHVMFTKEYLLVVETLDNIPLICSSFPLNSSEMNSVECQAFSYMEEDFNFDGSIDNFNFKFKINLNQPSTINSLNIILLFDVQIYASCMLETQGVIFLKRIVPTNPFEGGSFYHESNVIIQQNKLHDCLKNIGFTNNTASVKQKAIAIEDVELDFISNFLLSDLIRNETNLKLTGASNIWINENRDEFELNFLFHILESQINFSTSFWYIMKWALVQYLCIALIIMWILDKLKKYLFKNQYLMAWCIKPYKKLL